MQAIWMTLVAGALALVGLIWAHASAPLSAAALAHRQVGELVLEDVPLIPKRIASRMAKYHPSNTWFVVGWEANGDGLIVSQQIGQQRSLWRLRQQGVQATQVDAFETPIAQSALNPDPSRKVIVYLRDDAGNERYQIYLFDQLSGRETMVSDGVSGHTGVRWSNRGDRFVFSSNRRNGRDWDVYVSAMDTPTTTEPVVQAPGVWVPVAWSPDDRLLLVRNLESVFVPYQIMDLAAGVRIPLDAIMPITDVGGAKWSYDGEGLFFIANRNETFRRLYYFELKSGALTPLSAEIPWDVQQLAVSATGNYVAFTANENGISRLYVRNLKTRALQAIDGLPAGQVFNLVFHPDDDVLAFNVSHARSPGDVYVWDTATQRLVRWALGKAGVEQNRFIPPQPVAYPTFDEENGTPRQIPAFYYRPQGQGPFPVLIFVHGGPTAQFVPGFIPEFQYLLNELGVAVLAPNVRGSSGYGVAFSRLDDTQRRMDAVRDIGALLDWIAAQPELDAQRVAVMGESYGGFLALSTLIEYPKRLRAGVDIAGISNLVTFLESRQGFGLDVLEAEFGSPERPAQRRYLTDISPLNHVAQIAAPLLVIQGANDARVPAAESQQLVNALRAQGNVVWFLLAQDEGHIFRKPHNRHAYKNAIALFLETFLLP